MGWELRVIYWGVGVMILMVIGIVGMGGWVLYGDELIEKKSGKCEGVYGYIYN